MTIWAGVEAAVCMLLVFARRRMGFLCYQIAIASVYLLALAMDQTLDYTMSVYFFFAVAPYAASFGCPTKLSFLALLYFAFVAVLSVLNNGVAAVASALIIHYLGLLLIVYLYARVPERELYPRVARQDTAQSPADYAKTVIVVALVFETVVGVLAMSMSSSDRLMLNYQCVAGCLSCVCMVLLCVVGRGGRNMGFVAAAGCYALFWAVTSGTRGYIVLAAAMFAVVVGITSGSRRTVVLVAAACAALLIAEVALPDGLMGTFLAERFSASTGRRGVENAWAVNMFFSQGLLKDLFGVGLGTTYKTLVGATAAFAGTGVSSYNYEVIMSSATLHNFWYTCILSIGVVGFALYVCTLGGFLRKRLGGGAPVRRSSWCGASSRCTPSCCGTAGRRRVASWRCASSPSCWPRSAGKAAARRATASPAGSCRHDGAPFCPDRYACDACLRGGTGC